MTTKMVSFRPDTELLDNLSNRINNELTTVHQVANRDMARYYNILKYALREVALTEQEAMLVCDALNGVFFDDFSIRLMRASVEDAIIHDRLDEKWGVDGEALIVKLRSYSIGALYSVADAVEQWWSMSNPELSNYEKLLKVGLLK